MDGPYHGKSQVVLYATDSSGGVANFSVLTRKSYQATESTWCFYRNQMTSLKKYYVATFLPPWRKLVRSCADASVFILKIFVLLYRNTLGVHVGGACRFHPSCSQFALNALNTHPLITAIKLILQRLARCRPGGSYGYDPVPPRVERTTR